MRSLLVACALVVSIGGAACGDDGAAAGGATGAGGNGGAGGVGGSGGTSTASTTSTGAGGTGGSGGAPFELCASGRMGLEGVIDAEPLELSTPGERWVLSPYGLQASFGTEGRLQLGSVGFEDWLLRMPAESALDGQWLCSNDFTSEDVGGSGYSMATTALRRLGTCPGTPVDGSITFCADDGAGCAGGTTFVLDGTIEGAPLDPATDAGALILPEYGIVSARFADGDGLILLYDDGASGLVLVPSPMGGVTVYCTGSDTTVSSFGAEGVNASIGSVSRLGRCADAPIVGELAACILP